MFSYCRGPHRNRIEVGDSDEGDKVAKNQYHHKNHMIFSKCKIFKYS